MYSAGAACLSPRGFYRGMCVLCGVVFVLTDSMYVDMCVRGSAGLYLCMMYMFANIYAHDQSTTHPVPAISLTLIPHNNKNPKYTHTKPNPTQIYNMLMIPNAAWSNFLILGLKFTPWMLGIMYMVATVRIYLIYV